MNQKDSKRKMFNPVKRLKEYIYKRLDLPMNLQTGVDLDPSLVRKIECLLKGTYQAVSSQEDAQLRELAFWRWVAFEGYAGRPPEEFIDHQKQFMMDCFRRTGWQLHEFSEKTVFEFGCGPLGMIEFIPGRTRHGFDPLNSFYSRLFQKLRSPNVNYIDSEEDIRSLDLADLGICFNVLDHTMDADYWFDLFFSKIRPDGKFILQVNTVKYGFERTEEHKKMHPSPLTYEQIVSKIRTVSSNFSEDYRATPSADNEFFFMAWGIHNV